MHALQRCSGCRVSVNEIILFVTRTDRARSESPWPDVELIMGHCRRRRPIINSIWLVSHVDNDCRPWPDVELIMGHCRRRRPIINSIWLVSHVDNDCRPTSRLTHCSVLILSRSCRTCNNSNLAIYISPDDVQTGADRLLN